ncbi:aminotransferase class III-fold pyridoxal phosphate-dependent enzyme, partial [Streptococcus pneumoniae]|uniref:aminotransferase class III-fold pyridoxal phosphate-dependent enzyme n=1 Tax=Streptococcus pneumoniae TaxID=1313 RepID=UPI001EF7AC31
MANPFACAIAAESIRLLLESPRQQNIQRIEHSLKQQLSPLAEKDYVKEVRALGAIGVVEMKSAVNMKTLVPRVVEQG